jgi:hypothetical protein
MVVQFTCGAKPYGTNSTSALIPAAKPRFRRKKFRRNALDHPIRNNTPNVQIMAKKRKAGSGAPKARKEEDSKLAISTYEDVADSEDEFHMNRDKVLLDEGPAAKRLRKWQEEG